MRRKCTDRSELKGTTITFPVSASDKQTLQQMASYKGLTTAALIRMVLKEYLSGDNK